ncbi:hypothetical protein CFC21_061521, partial [Triticum aestivum]
PNARAPRRHRARAPPTVQGICDRGWRVGGLPCRACDCGRREEDPCPARRPRGRRRCGAATTSPRRWSSTLRCSGGTSPTASSGRLPAPSASAGPSRRPCCKSLVWPGLSPSRGGALHRSPSPAMTAACRSSPPPCTSSSPATPSTRPSARPTSPARLLRSLSRRSISSCSPPTPATPTASARFRRSARPFGW